MVFQDMGFIDQFFGLLFVAMLYFAFRIVKSLIDLRDIFKFARNFNGYRFYPVVGNGLHFVNMTGLHVLQDLNQKFGFPCNVWLGHDYYYVTADASEVKAILNSPKAFSKMQVYDGFSFVFGKSLLMAEADVWKKHRKYYSKSFSQPLLNGFVECFYKKSTVLVHVLLKNTNYDSLYGIIERYSYDCFCETMLSMDYDLQVKPKVRIAECLNKIQVLGGSQLVRCYYYPMWLWLFSKAGRTVNKLLSEVKKIINDAIKERKKILAQDSVYLDTKALPLLDSMLQAPTGTFSNSLIFEESFFFAAAATDTSSLTMAFVFTLLGMHHDIQELVFQEVISIVGCDRPIYVGDLPKFKYLETVLFETMRLLPVVPTLGRHLSADIEIGPKVIPKNSNVMINVMHLHRNEKYWPDPLKFDPNRFLPEEVAKRDPYAFVPFSAGPKNCIGKTFAMMMMKTAIANVVRNFEIFSKYKCITELKLESCVTMRTSEPLDCHFKPRTHVLNEKLIY